MTASIILSASLPLLLLIVLTASIPRTSAFFSFKAYNDSLCTIPVTSNRYTVIDLPDVDFITDSAGIDQCAIDPYQGVPVIVYRCLSYFTEIDVFTRPTVMNATYCPTPYIGIPTIQISSINSNGPTAPDCWSVSYNEVDWLSNNASYSRIFAHITCGTNAATDSAASPASHSHSIRGMVLALLLALVLTL